MIDNINQLLLPLENFIKKYRTQISYFLIGLSFLSLYHIWSKSGEKESGEQALNVLWVILWLPILARVGGLKVAQVFMPLRKELGILMGTLAFVHSGIYIIPYWEELLTKGFWISDGSLSYLAFGFFALVFTIPLTLTSNNWSMRTLGKKWKFLHRCVYFILILTVIHVVLLNWFLYFKSTPVILLVLYFIGKILEWSGVTFQAKKGEIIHQKGQKWICVPCGYIYDPSIGDIDSGVKPGTEFKDIPDSWTCPLCGVKKSDFIPYNEDEEEATSIALVKETKMLNPTTIELVIETEEDHKSHPGQFMSFLWKDENGQFPRTYSIAKQEGKTFMFLIKLSKEGRGAKCIKELEVGSVIRIRTIAGRFILSSSDNNKVFIATGTGLAPIFRMLLAEIEKKSSARKSLYFSVSTKEDLFYADELKSIKNLNLHIHITRENVDGYEFGRVDVGTIEADLNTEWYLCGNPKMVSEAREKLTEKGYKNIFCEEF